MSRFVTYSAEPQFPPDDQFGPGTEREQIAGLWVDHIDGKPSDDDVDARTMPVEALPSVQDQIDAIKGALVKKDPDFAQAIDAELSDAKAGAEIASGQ